VLLLIVLLLIVLLLIVLLLRVLLLRGASLEVKKRSVAVNAENVLSTSRYQEAITAAVTATAVAAAATMAFGTRCRVQSIQNGWKTLGDEG
jgi:hypothetical protein